MRSPHLHRHLTRIAGWFASPADTPPHTDAETQLAMILAQFQPIIDGLTALPAAIAADKTAAVAAAEAQAKTDAEAAHATDVTDTFNAVQTALTGAQAAAGVAAPEPQPADQSHVG
ncbi:MAG: hypothetical protein JOZ27_04700 [Caulobacteraceae bacterium]|nr:hypothetical protein [Caulobacteraceae bacterium]